MLIQHKISKEFKKLNPLATANFSIAFSKNYFYMYTDGGTGIIKTVTLIHIVGLHRHSSISINEVYAVDDDGFV